jgi:hypothetical protein
MTTDPALPFVMMPTEVLRQCIYVLTWDAAKLFEDCLRQADSEGRLPENLRDWPTYDRRAYETLLFFGFLERARERGALEAGVYLAQGILGPKMLEAHSGLDQFRRGNLASAAGDLLAEVHETCGQLHAIWWLRSCGITAIPTRPSATPTN